MQSAQRVLIGGGAAYDCDLGWVPDLIEGFTYNATPDSIVRFRYMGQLAEDDAVIAAGGGIYGWSIDGAVVAELTADTGFTPYEEAKVPRVLIVHPLTGLEVPRTVADYTSTLAEAATARSATVIGTILRPTTHNGYVYECSDTTGSAGSSEPTWGTTPGEETADGTLSFTCRKENIVMVEASGITLGATLMTDGNTVIFYALKFDDVEDLGDIG